MSYAGKIIDKHIFLVCEDNNGRKIQCPHVELFVKNGYHAVSYDESRELREPWKFLTKQEVTNFFKGLDTDGNRVKTPSEFFVKGC